MSPHRHTLYIVNDRVIATLILPRKPRHWEGRILTVPRQSCAHQETSHQGDSLDFDLFLCSPFSFSFSLSSPLRVLTLKPPCPSFKSLVVHPCSQSVPGTAVDHSLRYFGHRVRETATVAEQQGEVLEWEERVCTRECQFVRGGGGSGRSLVKTTL